VGRTPCDGDSDHMILPRVSRCGYAAWCPLGREGILGPFVRERIFARVEGVHSVVRLRGLWRRFRRPRGPIPSSSSHWHKDISGNRLRQSKTTLTRRMEGYVLLVAESASRQQGKIGGRPARRSQDARKLRWERLKLADGPEPIILRRTVRKSLFFRALRRLAERLRAGVTTSDVRHTHAGFWQGRSRSEEIAPRRCQGCRTQGLAWHPFR